MNKNLIKDALALTLITLVAGCLLGFVHMVTEKPIADQNEKIKQAAYQEVYPDAKSFVAVDQVKDSGVIAAATVEPEKDAADALKAAGLEAFNTIDEILVATDTDVTASSNPNPIGFVMTVTNKEAYGGSLTLTMGIALDGTVTGVAFTKLEETAGLGMKAAEPEFKDQFKNKKVDAFQYSKSGASADNEIDALSGATITTNAVTNGVNAGIAYFNYVTGGAANE